LAGRELPTFIKHMCHNKPSSQDVCLKSLADGHTKVFLALEFVESAQQQAMKQYADEGKAAAVTVRMAEYWHNQMLPVVFMDSWFASMLTAIALMQRGLHSIGNIKTRTEHVRIKEFVCGCTPGQSSS
jgi:hypothetical protein